MGNIDKIIEKRVDKFIVAVIEKVQEKHIFTPINSSDYKKILQRIIMSNLKHSGLHRFLVFRGEVVKVHIDSQWREISDKEEINNLKRVHVRISRQDGNFHIISSHPETAGFEQYFHVDFSFLSTKNGKLTAAQKQVLLTRTENNLHKVFNSYTFRKTVYEFYYQRALYSSSISTVNGFHREINVDELFHTHWAFDYLEKFKKTRNELFRSIKQDDTSLETVAMAINPLFLAMWQQWNVRYDKKNAAQYLDFFKETLQGLTPFMPEPDDVQGEGSTDNPDHPLYHYRFSTALSEPQILLLLASVFALLNSGKDSNTNIQNGGEDSITNIQSLLLHNQSEQLLAFSTHSEKTIKNKLVTHLRTELNKLIPVGVSSPDIFLFHAYAIAICTSVSNMRKARGSSANLTHWLNPSLPESDSSAANTTSALVFKRRTIAIIHEMCKNYVGAMNLLPTSSSHESHSSEAKSHKQQENRTADEIVASLNSVPWQTSKKQDEDQHSNDKRIDRLSLYFWLLYRVTLAVIEDYAVMEQKKNEKHIELLTDSLFYDICYFMKLITRYHVFSFSSHATFESRPAMTSRVLLTLIHFHSTKILGVNMPSSLMRILINSFETENRLSSLTESTHHIRHLTDVYLFGQYLASSDFKLKDNANWTEKSKDIKHVAESYAYASLFHDVGMLRGTFHSDYQWPVIESKQVFLTQLKKQQFISATEADALESYEDSSYHEHAYLSAAVLQEETRHYNLKVANSSQQNNSAQLKMEHPVRPAVRAILFHNLSYMPGDPESTSDMDNFVGMLLSMSDAIFTWDPSTTRIGNAENAISSGFGPAISGDLTNFEDRRLHIYQERLIHIKGHSLRRSLQFILRLLQNFSRVSFKEWGWEPILLLEVDDKNLLLDELEELSRSLFHEVCDGIGRWVQQQREFHQLADLGSNDYRTETETTQTATADKVETSEPIKVKPEKHTNNDQVNDIIRRCIYIESGTHILGNFEMLDFLQLQQVKDFIRFKSKFV